MERKPFFYELARPVKSHNISKNYFHSSLKNEKDGLGVD
jgi:hypothetical protein